MIDAEWAESFLNPPIFDNLEDEGQKAQARECIEARAGWQEEEVGEILREAIYIYYIII